LANQRDDIRNRIKEEYMKSAKDPVYFMKKYCKIEHPKQGKIKFNLYPFQEQTLRDFLEHRYNIILKSRQMGISTLSAGYSLYRMLFSENFKILVIATKQDVAKNLVHKVKVMFQNLPSWMVRDAKIIDNNKLQLSFNNGSSIKAVSASPDAGRSEALSLLIIDEAAFVDKIDDIWTAAQMTLSTGGDAILLSTPNGVGNLFHRLWVQAEEDALSNKSEEQDVFNPINLKWDLHPDRDQKWRDLQTSMLGEKQAAQECDCDFISSGHTVVDGEIIDWYDKQCIDPKETRGITGDYWLWAYPDYNKSYAVVADVARGDGSDDSAFHVFDIETMEQVAEYVGKIGTTEYGKMLIAVSKEWNDALLVIERENVGWATIQVVLDDGYSNLYYTHKIDPYLDENIHLARYDDLKNKADMTPGFTTNSKTRPIVISKIVTCMREKTVTIRSKRLINQMYVFKWKNGKAQAAEGYHDDLVMALGIFLFVRDTALRLKQQGIDIQRKAVSKTFRPIKRSTPRVNDPWKMQAGSTKTSIRWLL